MTCALQALSLVGKAELVQVRFTTSHMRLRACDPYISSALIGKKKAEPVQVRFTTSNMRLRARDPYTSSALIVGKGGVGPSSVLTLCLRDQRSEYVSECKMDVKCQWIPIWHRLDRVSWSLGLLSKTTSWR